MCHLILLVPLLGVPLFWLLPLQYASTINVALWAVFGLAGYKAIKAKIAPENDGFKSLVGTRVTVVSADGRGPRRYLVRAGGELWTARCAEILHSGEAVLVTATEGIMLVVKRAGATTGVQQ